MSRTSKLFSAVLACTLLMVAGAGAQAPDDASDVRVGSQALAVAGDGPMLIDPPGDRDWYIEPGREVGAAGTAFLTVTLEGANGCTSDEPLRVALHNPEGAFMRSDRFAAAQTGLLEIPELPGNYFIRVDAPDPGCSGLTYRFGHVAKGDPAFAGETPCEAKVRKRKQAQRRFDTLRQRHRSVRGAARRRYEAYVNTARSQLSTARRQANSCRSATAPPPAAASGGGAGGGSG